MKPYKGKSLKGAIRRVRELEAQLVERDELLDCFNYERKMLAKLAADTPQFYSPVAAMEAKQIRDQILGEVLMRLPCDPGDLRTKPRPSKVPSRRPNNPAVPQ